MLDIPSIGGDTPAAVRRPVLEISFGGGAGGGGLAAAATSLLGGGADPWLQHVVAVTVEAAMAPAVDVAWVDLAPGAEAPVAALADEGHIALGYEDSAAEAVFTGAVDGVRQQAQGPTRYSITNGGALLARLRINQPYEQQSAGEIVQDLADQAGAEAETVEDGLSFPFYVIDDTRNAYQHIARLARQSGYLAYFTPGGALFFGPAAAGDPVQTFSYGLDILSLDVTEGAPVVGAVATVGEGAAGNQGQDAWHWLVKDAASVQGSEGVGPPTRLVSDAGLRSQEAAQSAAAGHAHAAAQTSITGHLWTPGAAQVAVGAVIEIAEVPQDALNGRFLVHRVRHHFSKQAGFTTTLAFSSLGDGGLGGLGGLL